jgi:hypothetical protein
MQHKHNFLYGLTLSLVMLALVSGIAAAAIWANGPTYLPLIMLYPTYTPTPTPTATLTPTPTRTPTRTPTVPAQSIINPSFEQGTNGWVVNPSNLIVTGIAYNGVRSAELGNGAHNRVASIAQQFTVPSSTPKLQYYQLIYSEEQCGQRYDYVTVYINSSEFTSFNLCSALTGNWSKGVFNLNAYGGQTVTFRMEFRSDGNTISKFNVDDFSFVP